MRRIGIAGFILCCVVATGACAQANVMMPWVPITLEFETKDARRFSVEITAEAMTANARKHWHEEPHQHKH